MNAGSNSILTTFLAVWGALLSSIVFGWNLYKDLRDRAKIKLSAEVRRIVQRTDGKYFSVQPDSSIADASQQLFVVIEVVNVGRRPIRWKGVGGHYRDPVNGHRGFVISARFLPKMLDEQEEHSEFTELDEQFVNNVKRLYIWDIGGREWNVSGGDMKKLIADAKKYSTNPG